MRIPPVVWRQLHADETLGPAEWAVYFQAWSGIPRRMSELAALARISRNTATRSCAKLVRRGWMEMRTYGSSRYPVALIPVRCQVLMAEDLAKEYDMAVYKGEFLMRKYLDLRIATDDFIDNARPIFLTNPLTGERLEYDRYYLLGVGFEFNGQQHYERTRRYSDGKSLRERQARDAMKKGLSLGANVKLVVVTADQLHPAVLEGLIPDRLPRRPIDTGGAYYQALAELCTAYNAEARG